MRGKGMRQARANPHKGWAFGRVVDKFVQITLE